MPKAIYRSEESHQLLMQWYDQVLEQFPVKYESCMIPTRYGDTHAIVAGAPENPPLILIHGAASNAASWQPNVESLSQHFRLYMLDIPGDGGKSAPVDISRRGRETADWLVDVLDNLQIEKAHFGGISLGGWTSLVMAKYEPQRINRLVLMAPVMFLPISIRFIWNTLLAGLWTTRQTVGKFLRFLVAPGMVIEPEMVEGMYRMIKHLTPIRSVPVAFSDADLQHMTIPVLFMVGEYEVLYNPQNAIERANHVFSDVKTMLIPNAAHVLTWEQPQIVNQAIIDFLSE